MAARDTVKRLVGGPAGKARDALLPEYRDLLREVRLLHESVAAAHQGIADVQVEQKALRERLDATLLLAEAGDRRIGEVERRTGEVEQRTGDVEMGLVEERRLNLRIAELTDVVTELVLPLHGRDIDPSVIGRLADDTL